MLFCLSVSVKCLAVKTASEMTYIVSSGALNSTPTNQPSLVVDNLRNKSTTNRTGVHDSKMDKRTATMAIETRNRRVLTPTQVTRNNCLAFSQLMRQVQLLCRYIQGRTKNHAICSLAMVCDARKLPEGFDCKSLVTVRLMTQQ